MASIRSEVGQWGRRPSLALTLVGVVLGAVAFGFTAAGVWYQFCLDQGDPEAAAAFADLAPPPMVILLTSFGLLIVVAVQLETLCDRARADQSPRLPHAISDGQLSVAPSAGVPDLVADLHGN